MSTIIKHNILPPGEFFHKGEKITINYAHLKELENNFKRGLPHYEVRINVEHDAKRYGKVLDIEATPAGLIAAMEFDTLMYEEVKKGKYKYFSCEYSEEYVNKRTNQPAGMVLIAVSLTNTPAHTEAEPLTLCDTEAARIEAERILNLYNRGTFIS